MIRSFRFFVFLFILFSTTVYAYPTVVIDSVTPTSLEGPIHHGLTIETSGISDPNLTYYEIAVKEDTGAEFPPWTLYSTTIQPYDAKLINVPFRNGIIALRTDMTYCVKVRAIYGPETTPWAERCGVRFPAVRGASTDEDGDGLSEDREFGFGLDPRDRDTDGDGRSDGLEVAEHTDPTIGQFPRLVLRSVSDIDFGNGNPMGSYPSQHQVIEIENIGDEPATITEISLANVMGEGDPAFLIGSHPSFLSQIPPRNKMFLAVSFIPHRRGSFSANLQIRSNDPTAFRPILLRGTGVGIPDCFVSPSNIDFGEVSATDQEVAVRDITVANRPVPGDTQPANLDNTPWGFTISSTNLGIAPGIRGLFLARDEEVTLPILFQHLTPGDYESDVEIRSFYCGTQRVHVTGRAR